MKQLYKVLLDCSACGKRFVMTHALQKKCPDCRYGFKK